MIENVDTLDKLIGLSRRKFRPFLTKSIHPADIKEYESQGWELRKKLKKSLQVKKSKSHAVVLEDRVWSIFYKMNFYLISGDGGAKMAIDSKDPDSPKSQIDIVSIDKEVAIAIECKSSQDYKRRPQFQEELGKFSLLKENFIKSIRNQFSEDGIKKQCVFVMFLSKIILSDNDKERAKQHNIILFDENDLSYYEGLVNHLGPAAKYQVLADMLPGKEIPGLSIKVPGIKSKMGGYNCYTFSISPEYLLKISYVSHRAKGKISDIKTYQRMLIKSRLSSIRKYINEEGIFPTNIVLNFEKGSTIFQKTKQEEGSDLESGVLGWLQIKATYKSAWIIDGQHRLFAYSGLEKAMKSKLSVLAFEGLTPSKQAQLFSDINAKQKSVKQSLLEELYSELNWNAEEPSVRITAIISKSIQDLNIDPDSPLFQRIQNTDVKKDNIKCITLTSIFKEIEKTGFHIIKEKKGTILQYGPLWGGEDNTITLKRTTLILKSWLKLIAEENKDWWSIGSGEGGGLAMNDGISTSINVLRSVFDYLKQKGHDLVEFDNKELWVITKPYGVVYAKYLASLSEVQRKAFRDLRGIQGVTTRTRQAQMYMRDHMEFHPEGLDKWIADQKLETNKNAKEIIEQIEVSLQQYIIDELKSEFGEAEEDWWFKGIPKVIRQKASQRLEDDDNKRGGKEYYFDLIDYKKVILENWNLFENIFGYGKGNKDKKTEWIGFVNDLRKIAAHPSSGKMIPIEEFAQLQEYSNWLEKQMLSDFEGVED